MDAKWSRENGKNYYAYKNHIGVNVKYKLVRNYVAVDALAHDINEVEELLNDSNFSLDV